MQVGYEKSLFSTDVSLHRVLSTVQPSRVINTVADRGKVGSNNVGVTPKTVKQHLP